MYLLPPFAKGLLCTSILINVLLVNVLFKWSRHCRPRAEHNIKTNAYSLWTLKKEWYLSCYIKCDTKLQIRKSHPKDTQLSHRLRQGRGTVDKLGRPSIKNGNSFQLKTTVEPESYTFCLFAWGLSSHSKIFHSYGERLLIFYLYSGLMAIEQ